MRVRLATGNAHKVEEVQHILGPEAEVVGNDTGVEETGTTFEENALLKARALAATSRELAVADDSGIEIDHLDGVLFIDHISRLKRERVVKKFAKAARLAQEENRAFDPRSEPRAAMGARKPPRPVEPAA